ncbi:hypothetical protein Golomagni_00487 [Golovinomyces magnicellulatus]|nr:hypothetical protein Golomagni_00487 [Golovinomyces magnicellulatus]
MHPSARFFYACRITLFTRANCSLCTNAKQILSDVHKLRSFKYHEIDIMKSESKKWRDLYEFDTPVIHINDSDQTDELPDLSSSAIKLMHRFKVNEVIAEMDRLQTKSNPTKNSQDEASKPSSH